MKFFVKVKPSAKEEKVEKVSENSFYISVKAPPREGRANEAVLRALAKYFDCPVSDVSLVQGHKSRQKIVEVIDLPQ